MPTLNIEGRRVKVDDTFMSLPLEEQNKAVDEIAASLQIKPSAAAPAEGAGIGMNATAGLNEAIYTVAGAPVDLVRGAMNLGIRGINAATGAELDQIPDDSFGGRNSIAGMFGAAGVPDPRSIEAVTTGERLARGVGEGVGYTLAPEAALAGLGRAGLGAIAPRLADAAGRTFGRSASTGAVARNSAAGGAAGAGATAAMDAVPEEYRTLAGMGGGLAGGAGAVAAMGVPAIVRAGGRLASDYAAPMTQSGRERLAGERLRDSATDISAVRQSLDDPPAELVPGSQPTTGQMTGDMGLLGLERGSQTKRPEPFQQRRADQNTARVEAMTGVQRTGAPEKVSAALRQRLQQLDEASQDILDRATGAAQGRASAVGQGRTPEAAGDAMRGSLEAARAQVKAQERALWDAVDPDGSLALSAGGTKQQAARIAKELPASAKPPSGEEAAVYGVLGQYGDVVPFKELTALQSRLKTEMRQERLANGESPAYRRMTQMNAAMQRDLETAVAGRVEAEDAAVQRGEMNAEQTTEAAINRAINEWRTGRAAEAAGQSAVGLSGSAGASRAPSLPPAFGRQGQSGGGFSDASRNPRLSADAANFDQAALGRLNAARGATKRRVEVFDNRTLAPIRRRPGTTSPYDMPASAVAQRVFVSGPEGFETVQTFRRAAGDEDALGALEDYAVDRLRAGAMRPDGTLDPAKVQNWRRAHADALRAFPELDRRFADAARASEAMANVAAQRSAALKEAQRGTLGRLMNLDDPEDAVKTIGGIFSAQDAAKRMAGIRGAIRGDPEALKGLRRGVVEHITKRLVGNTEGATSGQALIRSDQFQTFVKQNRSALQVAGLTSDEIDVMTRIATDLQRANRSLTAVKIPGQSNTAQDLAPGLKAEQAQSILGRIASGITGGGGYIAGGPITAIAGYVGGETVSAMRLAGIETIEDLIADAMLNPTRAKMLLAKVGDEVPGEGMFKPLARAYARSAVTSAAVSAEPEQRRKPLEVTITPPAARPGNLSDLMPPAGMR